MTAPEGHGPAHPADARGAGPADLLAFACELALLALLAVSGWRLGSQVGDGATTVVTGVLLAVGLPAVAVAVWGRWLARNAPGRLRQPARLVVQAALFVVAGALAAASGLPGWGLGVAAVGVLAFALTRRS
ncbi:YrdB family protein [Isoptericola sp. NPDC056605]|uniref:YrdB family protein n=1 Tax=Isoptericola sp. NPDC056605 TaxID=3345876 RepID=UPI00369E2897